MNTEPVGVKKYESTPPKLLKVPVEEYHQFCDLHTANQLASMMNKITGVKVVVEIATDLNALYNFPPTNNNINIYRLIGQYRAPDGTTGEINEIAGSLWDRKITPDLTLDKNFDGTVGGKMLVVTDLDGKATFKWGDGKSKAASVAATQPVSAETGKVGVVTGTSTGVATGTGTAMVNNENKRVPPTLAEVIAAGYTEAAAESIVKEENEKASKGYPPYGNNPVPKDPQLA